VCSSIFQVLLIGSVVLPLWVVENRPSPLLWPLAYTTACTTIPAVMNGPVDIHWTSSSCVGRTVGSCVRCRGAEQLIVYLLVG